jgi:multiple sugar transport system permease protein
LLPSQFSGETLLSFIGAAGTVPTLGNSLLVGIYTAVLSLLVGGPAGYALARWVPWQRFPGIS